MALNNARELGFYDQVHPCYTIFHQDSETFSNLWTAFTPDYAAFHTAYEHDMTTYGHQQGLMSRSDTPENTFPVSMLPWASFDGFNLNLQKGYTYLLPIFTMGQFYEDSGKILLPLAVQVHHAVCDGFHLCRLINEIQTHLNTWGEEAFRP